MERACLALLRTSGFARKAIPRPAMIEHWKIVGAVAYRDHLLQAELLPVGDESQVFGFLRAIDDFADDFAGDEPSRM